MKEVALISLVEIVLLFSGVAGALNVLESSTIPLCMPPLANIVSVLERIEPSEARRLLSETTPLLLGVIGRGLGAFANAFAGMKSGLGGS